MFSRAWHYEPVFPPSALATFFPHALRRLNVSHTLHWLHVFPRLLGAGYMFFHALLLVTFFPHLLDTGYMFSHACLALFTCLPMNIENYFYCNTVSLLKANSHWLYSQIQHKKDFYLMVGTSSGYLANRQSWILLVFSQWPLCRIAIKQNTILSGSR